MSATSLTHQLTSTSAAQVPRTRLFNHDSQLTNSQSQSRVWVNLFFIYVSVLTLAGGIAVTRISRGWIVSDWLINYQGGFVRRGLPGEAAYILGRLFHISPVIWIALFYLSLYAIIFLCIRCLVMRSSRSVWLLALLFSPATLSFQILHVQAGFRKELIYIAALALLATRLQEVGPGSLSVSISLTIAVVLCVLSHESLVFYFPYFVAALLLSDRPARMVAKECLAPAIAGVAACLWCSMHLGNVEIAGSICSSLGYPFPNPRSLDICGTGAIPYLTHTRIMARTEASAIVRQHHYLAIFPLFAMIGLTPAILQSVGLVRCGAARLVRILWTSAAISMAGTSVLFLYAIDWGRWIYIHLISLTILLLFMDTRANREPKFVDSSSWAPTVRRKRALLAMLGAYYLCWALPNNLDDIPRMGYVGELSTFVYHFSSGVVGSKPAGAEHK